MAKEAKQIDLELEDNKKAEDTNEKTEVIVSGKEDKDIKSENDIEKRLMELQEKLTAESAARKLADEKAARLEKESHEANAKATQAEGKAAITQKDAILNALASSEESLNTHRAAYKAALEAGDSEKAVESQEKFTEAKYLNSELKKQKVSFEQWEKQQEELAKRPKEVSLPPSVQEWINRNPKYTSDSEFKAEADSAHDSAIRRGYGFGTQAYMEFIDKRLEKIFQKNDLPSGEDVKPKKDVSYSAPPNRGSAGEGGNTGGGKKYKLTAEQVEAADICGMTPLQYAEALEKGQV